jgi:hypothetical protein
MLIFCAERLGMQIQLGMAQLFDLLDFDWAQYTGLFALCQ